MLLAILDAQLKEILNPKKATQTRKVPTCKNCKLPRKGHKKGLCTAKSTNRETPAQNN